MKNLRIASLVTAWASGRRGVPRQVARAGWPTGLGVLGFLCGSLAFAGNVYLHREAQRLLEAIEHTESAHRREATHIKATPASSLAMPADTRFLDDINTLHTLASAHGVVLGSIDYGSGEASTLPIVVRNLDLRLRDDYPKLKSLLSDLLHRLPHAYVREIQIERGDPLLSSVQVTVRLAMVYQSPSVDSNAGAQSKAGQ